MPPRHRTRPTRGDQRRAALLAALEDLLAEQSLAEIAITDITGRAGVTRSAFYFYFPTKAAAVAALLADFETEMQDAAADWYEGRGEPAGRVWAGFTATAALWRDRAPVLVAMLDAVGADAEVRAIWDRWIDGFVARVAARIEEDRAAGLAHDGPDAHAVAAALIGSVLLSLEREVRAVAAGARPSAALVDTLVDVWWRVLYAGGRPPTPPSRSTRP